MKNILIARFLFIITSTLLLFTISTLAQSGPYLGQDPPGLTPKLFVPNNLKSNSDWWWHGRLDFVSDGQEMFLDIYCPAEAGAIRVRYMKMINVEWTTPTTSPFSGSSEYADASPSFFDNGNKVIFISDRPNGYYGWYWSSTRTGDNWSNPLPVYVPWRQSLASGWGMCISKNETIYTGIIDNSSNTDFDIYMIKKINGQYVAPEKLDDNVNSSYMDLGAFIDPDEQYLIFESNRPGTGGFSDLYISFKKSDGTWTVAVNMGPTINTNFEEGSPYVSPDKKYLFFLSDRSGGRNPYWVDAQVITNMISDIKEDINIQIPDDFELLQNYPNPFNPGTTIKYNIPALNNNGVHIKLNVYDVLGNEVATLVNETQYAGWHAVKFNADNLMSGVYFYEIIINGSKSLMRKMCLIK